MVITCIREGFGNQLFMYACGYSLAKDRKTELVLDTTLLDCGNFRKLELLKTKAEYSRRLSYGRKEDLLSRAFGNKIRRRRAIGFRTVMCSEKDPWLYSPNCFKKNENIYLYGFWQSVHYFEKYEADLKRMIVPNYHMSERILEQIERVQKEESVAIHVRRGDYVQIGCELPLRYYQKAIVKAREDIPGAKFYVFSDDLEFARKKMNLDLKNTVFWEDEDSESSLNDFFLMSACRNQILANSTFSWWAAYLNKNKCKKIYAPVFGNWKEEFYPENWIKLLV